MSLPPALQRFFSEWMKDDVSRHAAAVAYYGIFSLPAVMLTVLSMAGWLLGDQPVQEEFYRHLGQFMSPETVVFLRDAIANIQSESDSLFLRIAGVVTLLAAGIALLRQLSFSVNLIFSSPRKRTASWWRRLRGFVMSFVMMVLAAVLLVSSVIVSAILRLVSRGVTDIVTIPVDTLQLLNYAVTFVTLTLLFFLLYLLLPNRRIDAVAALGGSVITGALFFAGTYLLTFYISQANVGASYGVAATVLILLLWVYYSALLFLTGAELIDAWLWWKQQRVSQR